MHYQISPQTRKQAELPHSLFTLNLIIVHLFASYTMLELGYGQKIIFIPFVSMLILSALWFKAKQMRAHNDDWFVNAHWLLMTKRAKILIIAYAVGITIGGLLSVLIDPLKGQTTNLIAMYLGGIPIFFGLLITFVLSGGSIYDARRGVIGQKIIDMYPAPAHMHAVSNAEDAGDQSADHQQQDH